MKANFQYIKIKTINNKRNKQRLMFSAFENQPKMPISLEM